MVDRSTGNLRVFIPLGGPGPKANDSLTVTAPITGGMGWAATPRRGWAATVFDKLVLTLVSFTLHARALRRRTSFFLVSRSIPCLPFGLSGNELLLSEQ